MPGMFRRRLNEEEAVYMLKMHDILGNPPISGVTRQATQLMPHLYIGGQLNAESMQTLNTYGITYVLNCGASPRQKGSPYEGFPVTYQQFLAVDDDNYNIAQHFNEAFSFIDKVKRKGAKVLVHCAMGINRSGAVCGAYMMKDRGLKLLEVCKIIKAKRMVFLTNPGFRYHLYQFAKSRGLLEPFDDVKSEVGWRMGGMENDKTESGRDIGRQTNTKDWSSRRETGRQTANTERSTERESIGRQPFSKDRNSERASVGRQTAYTDDDVIPISGDRLSRSLGTPIYRAPWRPGRSSETLNSKLNKHADVVPRDVDNDDGRPMLIYRSIRPMDANPYSHDTSSSMPIIDPSLLRGTTGTYSARRPVLETQAETPLFRHKPITPFYSSRPSRSASVDYGRARMRPRDYFSTQMYLH